MRKIVRNKKGGLKFYFVVVLIVINLKLGLIAMKKVIAPLRGQNESNSFANIAIEEKMHTQHWRLPLDFLEKCWELKESGILPTNHTTFLKPLFPPAPSGQAAEVQDIDLIVEALNAYHSLKTTYYKISGLMSTTHLLQRAEKGDIKLPKEVECLDAEISLEKKKHKKPKVAMVVVVTWPREEHSWVNASLANKEKYARQHGYGIHIVPALEGLGRKAPWSKIPWTLALMPAYDWIWWLDLDTVILNQTIVIEGFIDNSYMAVIGLDMNGLNTGSALYRSSSWTRMMFAEAWTLDKVDKAEVWWENAAIMALFNNQFVRNRVKVVPQTRFNSYITEVNVQNPYGKLPEGTFIVHFAGGSLDEKIDRLYHYLAQSEQVTAR